MERRMVPVINSPKKRVENGFLVRCNGAMNAPFMNHR